MPPSIWITFLTFLLARGSRANPKFEKIGTVYGTSSLAHLHIEVNVSNIYEQAVHLVQAVDRIEHQLDNVRRDGRCGPKHLQNGRMSHCNLNSAFPCCSSEGFCISDTNHHTCANYGTLINNRKILLKKLNDLKKSMNNLADEIQNDETRHKRSVVNVNVDVGTIFMHIFNGLSSIFNSHQLNHLKKEQKNLIKNIKILEDNVKKVHQSLSELELNVHDLSKSVYDNSRTLALTEVLNETTSLVRRMTTAIINLNSGIMSQEVLPIDTVKNVLPHFQNKIANEGYTLEATQPLQVYSLPFSFVIQNGILDLFIHFLAFNPLQKFSLWQYVQLPFFVNDSAVEVIDPHEFIAINEETENVMLLESVKQCNEMKSQPQNYVCPRTPILKSPQDYCLPSLFLNGNLKPCQTTKSFSLTSWFVTLIESVAVFFPEVTTLVTSCPNKETRVETIEAGVHFLNHTGSCSIHSDNILLPSRPHITNHSVSRVSVNISDFEFIEFNSPNHFDTKNDTLIPLEFEIENEALEIFQTLFSVLAFVLVSGVITLLVYFTFTKAPIQKNENSA